MLNTNIEDAPNFIRMLISRLKNTYVKITYELLSIKLYDRSPDFIFSIYYHQAIDLINLNCTNPCLLILRYKKSYQSISAVYILESDGVEFMNVFYNLQNPEINKSLRPSSLSFSMPVVSSFG